MNPIPLVFIASTIWLLIGLAIGLIFGAWEPFGASVIIFVFATLFFSAAALYVRWFEE